VSTVRDNVIQFSAPPFDPSQGFYLRPSAARLARVPLPTLRLWDKKGIVPPTVCWTGGQRTDAFGYTFEGLVYLRLIRMMRETERPFPMRKIVDTIKYLVTQFGPPGPKWVEARIVSDERDLWIQQPVVAAASRSGQMPLQVFFDQEFALFGEREDALLIPGEFMPWVEIKPALRNGMPIIRGTGIETAIIHAAFNQGLTTSALRRRYPFLTVPQINHSEGFEAFLDNPEACAA